MDGLGFKKAENGWQKVKKMNARFRKVSVMI